MKQYGSEHKLISLYIVLSFSSLQITQFEWVACFLREIEMEFQVSFT